MLRRRRAGSGASLTQILDSVSETLQCMRNGEGTGRRAGERTLERDAQKLHNNPDITPKKNSRDDCSGRHSLCIKVAFRFARIIMFKERIYSTHTRRHTLPLHSTTRRMTSTRRHESPLVLRRVTASRALAEVCRLPLHQKSLSRKVAAPSPDECATDGVHSGRNLDNLVRRSRRTSILRRRICL